MDKYIFPCDSPEKVTTCLNCPKPVCPGECELVSDGSGDEGKVKTSAFLPLYQQGLSDAEIARRLGTTRQTVFRHRRKLGLETNKRGGNKNA